MVSIVLWGFVVVVVVPSLTTHTRIDHRSMSSVPYCPHTTGPETAHLPHLTCAQNPPAPIEHAQPGSLALSRILPFLFIPSAEEKPKSFPPLHKMFTSTPKLHGRLLKVTLSHLSPLAPHHLVCALSSHNSRRFHHL